MQKETGDKICYGCALGTAAYARGWDEAKMTDVITADIEKIRYESITVYSHALTFQELYPDYPSALLEMISDKHFTREMSRLELADWIEEQEYKLGLRTKDHEELEEETIHI